MLVRHISLIKIIILIFLGKENNFNNEKTKREITAPHIGKRSILDDEKEKLRIDFKLLGCG